MDFALSEEQRAMTKAESQGQTLEPDDSHFEDVEVFLRGRPWAPG